MMTFVVSKLNQLLLLQPMLQELGKQNPQLLRMIQEHNAEFLQLINEPLDGSEGWVTLLVYMVKSEKCSKQVSWFIKDKAI